MPHVMPKWYRERTLITDEKTRETKEDHADLERREFIREAAIVICASGWCGQDCDAAWVRAERLWNAKPEDL